MAELKPFQLRGVELIEEMKGRVLLADEMGLGKTLQALGYLSRHPELRPAVIVTPASLKWHWQNEARTHFGMRAGVLEGRPKGHRRLHDAIVILNYDILPFWLPALIPPRPRCVILDEVHYIKNSSARRTRAVFQLVKEVPSVLGLSGTPFTNRPIELWSVLKAIRPGLFPSKEKFAWRYCQPKWTPWGWQYNGATRLKELHQILYACCMIRRKKTQVLDQLPSKTRRLVFYRLPDRSEYQRAREDFLHWLAQISPARAVRAARSEALTKVGYLLRLVARLKLDWTEQWIRDFLEIHPEEKLVCFTSHTFVIDRLKEAFGDTAAVVDGRVSGVRRHETVRRFQCHRKTRLFLGNWTAAGVGINLTASHHLAALDLPWTPAELVQGEDRIHRMGQEHRCTVHYLTALDTLEEKQIRLLQKKADILESVLDGARTADSLDLLTELISAE